MQSCSKCGAETEYKNGVSKKGNTYEGYKCLDEKCNNFDFINKPKQPTHQLSVEPSATTGELVMLSKISEQLNLVIVKLDAIISLGFSKDTPEPIKWDNPPRDPNEI